MEKYDHIIIKGATSFVAAIITHLYGGWSPLLGVLLVLMCADYLTGVFAAGREGKLSSQRGLRGIAKKIGILLLVSVAHMVDVAMESQHIVRDTAIYWFTANELLSIIENAGRMGIPVPPVFRRAAEVFRQRGEGDQK